MTLPSLPTLLPLLLSVLHFTLLLCMPILLIGVVNRTTSWWAGRRGPGLLQSGWDLRRLLAKQSLRGTHAGPLFQAAPYVALVASVLSACMLPLLGAFAPLQFPFDFVVAIYLLGVARVALLIGAMDVGSAFAGMGAARAAGLGSYAEPALFLLLGSACAATGMNSFSDVIGGLHHTPLAALLAVPALLLLFILLQTECSRVPVDDPRTHLELTMIDEAMLLDYSGPELAAMQFTSAVRMTLYAGLMASLVNPFNPGLQPLEASLFGVCGMLVVALAVGCTESWVARLPMRWVSSYTLVASVLALLVFALVGLGLLKT